jgi:SOS response regulatory protein OraA/RecX
MTPEERAAILAQELCLRGDTVEIEIEWIAGNIREAIHEAAAELGTQLNEANTVIARLRARIAELEADRVDKAKAWDMLLKRSARVAELEEALQAIEQACMASSHPHCLQAYQLARAALERKP